MLAFKELLISWSLRENRAKDQAHGLTLMKAEIQHQLRAGHFQGSYANPRALMEKGLTEQ